MILLDILVILSAIAMMVLLVIKQPIKIHYRLVGFFLVVLLILLQVIIGHAKWQLYPLYGFVLLSSVWLLLQSKKTIANKLRVGLIIVSASLLLLSITASFVFPVYSLPTPSGSYLIGTTSYVIDDSSREELYNDDVDTRTIKIQLWYPADTIDGYKQVPWLEDGRLVARALSVDTGLPAFVLDHTKNILSNSYKDAPISSTETSYPVVIISHGWRGFRNLHTDFAEELASHGYIVISIDHTYGTVATRLDDEVAYLNLDALPDRDSTDDFLLYANQLVNTYGDDVITTLDYLEDINDGIIQTQFDSTLDLSNIGVIGHSTGGGGGVAAALQDNRIDAVFGLDAWVESIDETILEQGLDVPSVFVRSGAWEVSYNNEQLYNVIENSTSSILYQIDGTTHYDFSMVYMYSPLTKAIGFTGDVEGRYLNTILETMITEFFDETLKSDSYDTLTINEWEEVREIQPLE